MKSINWASWRTKVAAVAVASLLLAAATISIPTKAHAASYNYGKVSFTFDDAYLSTYTKAAPILAQYGFTGTDYVTTGCVGSVNTCAADPESAYMNWSQVLALKNSYGWEIGAHGSTHTPMTGLNATRKQQQITQSQQAFTAQGLAPTAYASPEGDYDPATLALLSKYYSSHRGFHDTGYNVFPYNDYILRVQQVQVGVSVAQVKSYIDYAKANGVWLILVFHDIQDVANPDPEEFEYATGDLDQIASYAKQVGLSSTNVTNGLITSPTNLLTNGSFSAGFTGGWATDVPTSVKLDTASNGRIPNVANSVSMTSTTKTAHLFSPSTYVNASDTYVIKSYVKLTARTSGDVSYYIDEYNSAGNWVSGQYKTSVSWLFPEEKTFVYKPTSAAVSKASLQVILPANTGITAFVDNFEWFSTTGTPVNPPPAPTNLVANGDFDSGIGSGWTTDRPTSITADNTSQGSGTTPQTSIKMTSGASNGHLFSPKVNVTYGTQYQMSCYLNIFALGAGGYIAYYVDEYDANGNWISGQYKTDRSTLGTMNVSFSYTPSSANVKSASLQVIVGSSVGTTAYIDSIKWFKL